MIVAITNTPRPYAWGSSTAIAQLLGTVPSGGPEAELWLGSHPVSPATVVATGEPLAARLPFLLKILAADNPLSLQAHPTASQAQQGFARENEQGVPLDAPHRNYKDPFPKPEIIYALSDKFEALCGFRPVEETRELLLTLGLDDVAARLDALPSLFEWMITRGEGVDELIARVVALTKTQDYTPCASPDGTKAVGLAGDSCVLEVLATARMLAEEYPGDPGIIISLLLNRVTLNRGEALYLPAGNIHAYLRGLGVELMTASDNVLRGGLTPKHIDVPELLRVLDFTTSPVPYLRPEGDVYHPADADFALIRVETDASWSLTGPAVAICVEGHFRVAGANSSTAMQRGDAVYVTADEGALTVSGVGELFLATTV
ncbi:MAG: mannose-6-phosphate isomerase, class [Mycetocola sp.]|jgi:mannose-6-phosphate isomerase|nr:mannose-6-phosphate isomerase, class [Mycetocola sp.]